MSKIEQLKNFLITYEKEGENNSINLMPLFKGSFPSIDMAKFLDLETLSPALLGMDMFDGVKKINIVPSPVFERQEGTDIPMEFVDKVDKNPGGTGSVESINLSEDVEFNEEIYVYSLMLTQGIEVEESREKFLKEQGEGVCLSSTIYDYKTFRPQIRLTITFDNDKVEGFGEEYVDKMFSEAKEVFKKGESNFPLERKLILRCTKSSIKSN